MCFGAVYKPREQYLGQDRSDRLPWIERCTVTDSDIAFHALCIDVDDSF